MSMLTLLIPVDGSDFSRRSVGYAIRRAAATREPTRVHLLNVQAPIVTVNVKLFLSKDSLETYYREEGTKALGDSLARAQDARLETHPHIGVGDAARVILDYAAEKAVDEIVMGSHGRGALAGAFVGSVAQKVVHGTAVPVVLVK
jgi:nucleotide-binding universal stress UspA family protein